MTARKTPGANTTGVSIAGVGAALPDRVLTNADLERLMDTSDEWILQRTGIRERRVHTPGEETTAGLGAEALRRALDAAGAAPTDLDLVMVATMTPDMPTPSTSCVITDAIGAGNIGAWDINAACSGFVFGLNSAHAMIRDGMARTIAVIGADTITRFLDYSTSGRGAAIPLRRRRGRRRPPRR